MGCDTMPTKSSLDHGMQDREALQLVLENLSMIGLNSTLFEKDISRPVLSEDNEQLQVERKRVSANITENIPVPSSEHVAEIVGKQGCKIKALRNKTNTYIKTPGRGDEPVFIITGRREDVDMAKAEILQASEHFSNIRAQRKGVAPPPIQPGQITKTIRVPYRVVGLVVGPKGQTIKQIQQKTQTYIVTPSRERDPVFEITGLPESVEQARIEISNYIAARTGTFIDSEKKAIAPAVSVASNWTSDRSLNEAPVMPEEINEFLEEIFAGPARSPALCNGARKRNSLDMLRPLADGGGGGAVGSQVGGASEQVNGMSDQYVMWNHGFSGNLKSVLPAKNSSASPVSEVLQNSEPSSSSGSSSTYSSFSFDVSPLVRSSSFPVSGAELGVGLASSDVAVSSMGRNASDGLIIDNAQQPLTVTLQHNDATELWTTGHSQSTTVAGTNEVVDANGKYLTNGQLPLSTAFMPGGVSGMMVSAESNRMAPGMTTGGPVVASDVVSKAPSRSVMTAPSVPCADGASAAAAGEALVKNCVICECNRISAALVPCGHNLFCYDCVSSLVQSNNAYCPVCHQHADHALRILQ